MMNLALFIHCFLILVNVSQIYGNIITCSPSDDLLPSPLCCTSFYQCANGVPSLLHCGADEEGEPLVFDPNLKLCVHIRDYPCHITADVDPNPDPPSTPGLCSPGDDLLPNPDDCNSFFQCANGEPILMQCAANHEGEPPLVFDPNLKRCVYASEYSCRDPNPDPPSTPGLCSPGDDLLPNPDDCNSFFQCANGEPILMQCAANHEGEPPLVFDPNLKRCVYASEYSCRDPNPDPPSTPGLCSPGDDLLPNPDDCNSFFQCANGEPILMQCAANHEGEPPLVFDPNLKRCVYASEYSCRDPNPDPPSTPGLCSPGDDLLPNPDDCNSFFQCANGEPILMQCAANHEGEPPLVFDPNLKRCVYASEYSCRDPNPDPPSTPGLCSPGDDLLPNPDDCNSFFQCANGEPILMQCAANHEGEPPLVFDPNLKRCVYASEYSCRDPNPDPPSTPGLCSPGDDLLPNPDDCNSFFQCANGEPILMQCAANHEGEPPLVFDPNLKRCVYASEYSCRDPNPDPPSTPGLCSPGDDLLPNPDDCNSFFQCANGEPILMQCAANHEGEPPLVFDPNLKRCVYASEYSCRDPNPDPPSTPGLCSPGDDLLPNPDDCNSFFQCANGEPILMQCAANHEGEPPLVFDPNLKRCVYASEYSCRDPNPDPPSTPGLCSPGDDLLPNPDDCNSFFQCANGEPILMQCAANHEGEPPLVFDPNLKRCVYASEYSCRDPNPDPPSTPGLCSPGDDLLPNPDDCNSFFQCANGEPILMQCAANHEGEPPLVFDPNLKRCVYASEYSCRDPNPDPPSTPGLCSPGDDLLPNPDDCNSFFQCANGEPILMQCAANHEGEPPLVFDPNLKRCVYASEYSCRDPNPDPPSTPGLCSPGDDLLPNPDDCNSFFQCANGEPILMQCAANHEGEPPLVFDPNLKRCVYASEYSCRDPNPDPPSTPGLCSPGDDLLPNPDDCNSFFQCANGEPILMQCAANHEGEPPLVFDPNLKRCVYPHEYPCQCHKSRNSDECFDTKLNSTTNCAYCFDCSFKKNGSPACDSYENLLAAKCQNFLYNDVPYIEAGSDPCEVEIYPGRLKNISVTFNIDKNHPLDLYYLMDVSGSMTDDRDNLVLLSGDLIDTLKSLTTDFQIGYGSFIDKPRAPFGNAARNDYSFHNNLPLTNQTDLFMRYVRDTNVPLPDAYDVPESHGDALAQVIECQAEIGWRSYTRRVVLLATDATFHVAGDGALGNIYEPYRNDGCHLDSNGYYTKQLTWDYPSVQQLATAYSMERNTTTVIFATNTSTLNFYEQVASQFKSAYIATLHTDSSNILEVVRSEFAKIQSRMEIETSRTNAAIKFRYFSNCTHGGGEIETTFCENLPPSGKVTYTVQVDLDKCPDDPNETGTGFIINPVGLPTFVAVELVFVCQIGAGDYSK